MDLTQPRAEFDSAFVNYNCKLTSQAYNIDFPVPGSKPTGTHNSIKVPNLKAESLPESFSHAKHSFGLNQHNHHRTVNVRRPVNFVELEL